MGDKEEKRTTIHIEETVRELIHAAEQTEGRRNMHFRYRLGNVTVPEIEADAEALKDALTQLLDNAVRFTPDGGDVILMVSELMRRESSVTLEFVVQDDGIGMTGEKLEEVLTARVQPWEERATLSGLDLVRSYTAAHGGAVRIESGENMGTVVRITETFPFKNAASASPIREKIRDYYHFDGKRVLLVEDHPLNLEIAKNLLERVGIEVDTAVNGQEAVELFRQNSTSYDVVLMDIRMPVMDGILATREIRELEEAEGAVPIIALTASAYEGDASRSRAAGMNEALLKPIDPMKMYRLLSKYIYPGHAQTDA